MHHHAFRAALSGMAALALAVGSIVPTLVSAEAGLYGTHLYEVGSGGGQTKTTGTVEAGVSTKNATMDSHSYRTSDTDSMRTGEASMRAEYSAGAQSSRAKYAQISAQAQGQLGTWQSEWLQAQQTFRQSSAALKDNFVTQLQTLQTEALSTLRETRQSYQERSAIWIQTIAAERGENNRTITALRTMQQVQADVTLTINNFNSNITQLERTSTELATIIRNYQTNQHFTMGASAALLAEANARLSLAKNDVAQANTALQSKLSGTTDVATVQGLVVAAKESIAEAHDNYLYVVQAIRIEASSSSINQ